MTTTGEKLMLGSLLAASALTSESANHWHFVYCGSSGIAMTGANGAAHAVLEGLSDAADPCELAVLGVTKVKAGGSITKGDWIKSDANGAAVTASAADRLAGYSLGWATEGASTNDLVKIFFIPNATAMTGAELITSGALTVGVETSFLSITNTQAYTLADGSYVGQRKAVECTVVSGTPVGTLTINDAYSSEPTTWTFNAVGQRIELEWTATGWKTTRVRRAGSMTVTVGTTVMGTTKLAMQLDLSITDTVTSALPNGIVPGEIVKINCTTAGGSPAGTLTATYETLPGAAGTSMAVNATTDYSLLLWKGDAWMELASSSAAIT